MEDRTRTLLTRLAGRVRSLRHERKVTARSVADRAGLSARFYAQLEAGEANIAIGRLAAVADALEVPLAALLEEPPAPRLIGLLGLRGAGKSTIGPKLAKALGLPFVELDLLIEALAGLDLSEIFALHGEAYYRRLETRCLAERVEAGPCVIALSGGIVHNATAFALVERHCRTVWLRADPKDHMQRVLDLGDRRPIEGRANAMAELRRLLASREPLYRKADVTVDTSAKTIPQVVDELKVALAPARGKAAPRARPGRKSATG